MALALRVAFSTLPNSPPVTIRTRKRLPLLGLLPIALNEVKVSSTDASAGHESSGVLQTVTDVGAPAGDLSSAHSQPSS